MKNVLVILGLIAASLILNSCQWQSYIKITLTHFSLTTESVRLVKGNPTEQPISISVRSEVTDENGDESSVILAEGPLVDGKLDLNQMVTEPTKIVISAKVGEGGESTETTAVLKPGTKIEFVLVHRTSLRADYYFLQIKGKDHRSTDSKRKFSISGDLSLLEDFDPALTQVSLRAKRSMFDGIGKPREFAPILVDEGQFSIEGDLDEPTLFTIEISEHTTSFFGELEFLHAVMEPGGHYRVVPLGNNGKYGVLSDREGSVHTQWMTSWQFTPDYIALVDTWMESTRNWRKERKERVEHKKEYVRNYQVEQKCDHLNVTDKVKAEFVDPYPSLTQTAADELVMKRSTALRKILRATHDRDLARLIFDLSWILFEEDEIISANDADEQIATLQEFATKMDEEFVQQFITPQVDSLRSTKQMETRNNSLLPGHVAPEFTLTTLAGDEVSLSEVLSNNEMVLVDFWASWCGPCIASFPALKEMYAEYKNQGFEIVTISIDDSLGEWEGASAEQELPWIDLGDAEDGVMKSGSAPTASDYGVLWIPNKFLIDKTGCIVHKHFDDDELKEMLSSLSVGSS